MLSILTVNCQSPITMKGPIHQELAIYTTIPRMAYVLKHNTIEESEAVSMGNQSSHLDSHGAVLFRAATFLVSMLRSTGRAASDANRNCSVVIVLRRSFDPLAIESNTAKTNNRLARVDVRNGRAILLRKRPAEV
jgi:hypothetical protein